MILELNENETGLLISIVSNVSMTGTRQARAVVDLENKILAAYEASKKPAKKENTK